MYLEDFRIIVSKLEEDRRESEKYIDSLRNVDSYLCDFIFENKYSNILYSQNKYFLKAILGEELYDWVSWYIYDRPSLGDDKPNVFIEKVGYLINDLDSFMDFAQHGLCLKTRPKHENV